MNDRRVRHIRGGISILEHLKELFGQRITYVELNIKEARRLMEEKMAGFPTEYAKKPELEQTASLVKDLKDKDLGEIKSVLELKLGKLDYEQRHETLEKELDRVARELANIQGRIIGTGGVIAVVVITVQILLHVFWKK